MLVVCGENGESGEGGESANSASGAWGRRQGECMREELKGR